MYPQVRNVQSGDNFDAFKELYSLAQGPDLRITSFSGCFVNGVKYAASCRDSHRKTQNCGIRVEGEHCSELMDFYGILKEVIELSYRGRHQVVLFKCDWYDCRYKRSDKFFTSINVKKLWYANEPYILANQASQVFYVQDTKLGGDWQVVQYVDHRHIWDPSLFECQIDPNQDVDTPFEHDMIYQQGSTNNLVNEVEDLEVSQLDRSDMQPEIVELENISGHPLFHSHKDSFIDDGPEIGSIDSNESEEITESFSS